MIIDGDKMTTFVVLPAIVLRGVPVHILEHNMVDLSSCSSHRRIENKFSDNWPRKIPKLSQEEK